VTFQQQLGEGDDFLGLGQPACAAVLSGQPPGRRFEHHVAAAAQCRDVVDGRGVLPHLGVHGRCEQHRTSRGQQRRGQQVVGAAVGGTRKQVGGGGRDDHEVGGLADGDVRHLRHVVEHPGLHGLTG
jgi:hypothetical protein